MARVVGKGGRPVAQRSVAPRVPREEGDLRGSRAESRDVVEVEVLQLIGTDLRLRALQLLVFARGHQLRRDLGVEDREECLRCLGVELPRLHHPTHQVLDQRFRHRGVHVVMAHVVADPVGAPAERQLREIARAEHERLALVGEAEEVIGAQPRLHVFEGHVV